MKHIITKSTILLLVVSAIFAFTFSEDTGKVHLKVTKDVNGEKSIFEKTYDNVEALKADEELKSFDLMVKKWTDEDGALSHTFDISHKDGEKIIVMKKTDASEEFTWTSDEDSGDGEKHIIVKKKGDEGEEVEIKKVEVITVESDNGEQTFTIKIDADDNGNRKMIWVGDDGEVTELTDEKIDELIQKHKEDGEDIEIKTNVEVITTDEEDGVHKVIIKKDGDGNETTEMEVEIEEEIDENGGEKVVNKKVWISKDGEKVELDGEDAYEFKTDGKKIKVIVSGENLDNADFSGGEFEGDKDVFIVKKGKGDGSSKQTMDVNIEEKNGETFIDIDIKRDAAGNVTISEIIKEDASLKDVGFSLKNNLKPSQLNYYPNPNDGKFNLKFKLDQKGEVTVKVMDILGNEVYKESILDFDGLYDNQLDLTGREKGVYVLQVLQNKKVLSRKILIE